jgi:cytochrome c biogenesis protein CcdA
MTVVVSFTLAALLYSFLAFRPETSFLIYLTAGFLIAMGAWHIQTFIRNLMLRKQLQKWKRSTLQAHEADTEQPRPEQARLQTANLRDIVPASVTEHTTKHLDKVGKF